MATGVCASVDHITITEAADASQVRDPAYLFGTLGFGVDPTACDPNDPSWGPAVSLNGMYEETLAAVACRLGLSLERVETDHVLHPATGDIELPAGLVRAGTVSHANWRWHAVADGRRRLTMSIHCVRGDVARRTTRTRRCGRSRSPATRVSGSPSTWSSTRTTRAG